MITGNSTNTTVNYFFLTNRRGKWTQNIEPWMVNASKNAVRPCALPADGSGHLLRLLLPVPKG